MELFDFTRTQKVLEEIAVAVRDGYIERLKAAGHVATERLVQSVREYVVVGDGTYEVVLRLEDYWKYVENDTRGRQTGLPGRKDPPFAAIYKWVQVKRLLPRPGSKIPTQEGLAWAIKHHIGEYGTKGSHDLEKTKDAVLPEYMEKLRAAIGEDAVVYITRYIAQVFK